MTAFAQLCMCLLVFVMSINATGCQDNPFGLVHATFAILGIVIVVYRWKEIN